MRENPQVDQGKGLALDSATLISFEDHLVDVLLLFVLIKGLIIPDIGNHTFRELINSVDESSD